MKTVTSMLTALTHLGATTAIAAPITRTLARKTYLGSTSCVLVGLTVSNLVVYATSFVVPAASVQEDDLMGNTIGTTLYLAAVARKEKKEQEAETDAILARPVQNEPCIVDLMTPAL